MSERVTVRHTKPDYILLVSVFAMLVGGLVVIYSVSPVLSHKLLGTVGRNYFFLNQLVGLGVGLALMALATRVPYTWWRRASLILLVVAFVASLALFIPGLGVAKNGATRWLNLGGFNFQPAELFKVALMAYLASWLANRADSVRSIKEGLIPFLAIVVLACIPVVIFQRDLGTVAVIVSAALAILFVAGMRWRHLGLVVLIGTLLFSVAIVSFPHRLSRFTTFLNPTQDVSGAGYHVNQALIAIGSGGVLGLGLGKSVQVYGYLPEAANDSIFAIIAEEFGLVGALLVIVGFGVLAYRGYIIAANSPDSFGRLFATGVTTSLLFQALINIGAMLSVVPLTGIPLPFISYGGSSMVISLLMVGILFNVSKFSVKEASYASASRGWWHRRPHHPNSGYGRSLTRT